MTKTKTTFFLKEKHNNLEGMILCVFEKLKMWSYIVIAIIEVLFACHLARFPLLK
jgi:hypothetical protein